MLILAFILIFPPVIFTSLTYLIFTYEVRSSMSCDGYPDKFWSNLAKVWGHSIYTQIRILLTYPLGFIPFLRHARKIKADQPLIVMVHGLYHNPAAWLSLQKKLRKQAYSNLFCWSYSSWKTDFESIEKNFELYMKDLIWDYPEQNIILIGHSLGGLIIKNWAGSSEYSPKIKAIITLGTPFWGSKLAGLGLGKLARELEYKGMLVRKVFQQELPFELPKLVIYNQWDNMVFPAQALSPGEKGWTEKEAPPVCHIGLLYSKSVHQMIVNFLKYL